MVIVKQVYRFLNRESRCYLEGRWNSPVEAAEALAELDLDMADYSLVMTDEVPTPPTFTFNYAEAELISVWFSVVDAEWGGMEPEEVSLYERIEAWLSANAPTP